MNNPTSDQGNDIISLAALKAKREELEQAINEIDEAIEAFENVQQNNLFRSFSLVNSTSNNPTPNSQDDYTNTSIYKAAIHILRKRKKELTTDEIIEELEKGGRKTARITVATTLYKAVREKKPSKIELARPGVWKLA